MSPYRKGNKAARAVAQSTSGSLDHLTQAFKFAESSRSKAREELKKAQYRLASCKKELQVVRGSGVVKVRKDCERAEIARKKLDLALHHNGLEDRYCAERHKMMIGIYQKERFDRAALQKKREFMQVAGLLDRMEPDEVLYYVDERRQPLKVHLFFGGRISPLGKVYSPDGLGHGHATLVRQPDKSYAKDFIRQPKSH